MSRNGSGIYNLPAGNPVVTGTTITSSWANTTMQNIADGLTQSVASDGQTPMTGALNMANNKITSVTDPSNAQDAATKAYVDAATGGLSSTYLAKASNLSDVANATTSRTNLGLGTIATQAANSVAITGGAIDATTVGATTPSTVKATGLTVTGSTSGTLAISATAIAGTNTATFPAATGTVMVSGNMPAFSAYQGSNQTITSSTFTKVTFNTEVFDTNNNFASNTFTPTVAGYYQLNACAAPSSATTYTIISIYKNGSALYNGGAGANVNNSPANASGLVYMNGTTDYVDVYLYLTGTTPQIQSGSSSTYFNGAMVRAA